MSSEAISGQERKILLVLVLRTRHNFTLRSYVLAARRVPCNGIGRRTGTFHGSHTVRRAHRQSPLLRNEPLR